MTHNLQLMFNKPVQFTTFQALEAAVESLIDILRHNEGEKSVNVSKDVHQALLNASGAESTQLGPYNITPIVGYATHVASKIARRKGTAIPETLTDKLAMLNEYGKLWERYGVVPAVARPENTPNATPTNTKVPKV